MKKLSKFLVLLSAFGLGIAGCGETKESPAVSTPEESTPAASTPAESTPAESTPDASTPAESTPAVNEALQEAADYFYQIYKDQKISLQDYDLIAKVQGYDIEYVLTVKSGIEDNVSIALGDDGKYHVTVKYNIDDSTEDTVYELLAKIKDGEDVVEVKFERTVPQYKFTTYDEYVAAAKAGSKDVLNVKAYVTSRMDFSSSSKTSMYLQDADGHGYYVYKPNIDSSIDSNEKMAEAFPTGAEVLISGQAVIYSGQYEFTQGASVKLTGQTIESLPYKDVTEAFKNAKNNKDDSLIEYQNARVTLRNVKLGVVDGSYYYFTVDGGTARFNLYDTYYFLTDEQRNELKAKWHPGYTATLSGIMNVYSYEYQLYPDSVDSITITSTELSNADTANVFFESAKIPARLSETIELPSADGVAWTVTEGAEVASVQDGKLVLNQAEEDVEVKLHCVYSFGTDESYEHDFETLVLAKQVGGPGSLEQPYSTKEAMEAANTLEDGGVGTDFVYVGGVVSKASYNSKYGSYTIWLEDGDGEEEAFELYSVKMVEGLDFTTNTSELVGQYVLCGGYLQKYVDKNGKVILEMPYLKANASPTGSEFTPLVSSVFDLEDGNGSLAFPYSAHRVSEVANAYEDNAIGTEFVYVRGEVSKASYNSKYKSYTIWLKDGDTEEAFELYSVGMAEGLDFSAEPAKLVGQYVLCGGYLQKYVDKNGKVILEMPYLAATKSPTGENFTPTIIDVLDPVNGNGSLAYPFTVAKVVEVANAYEDNAIGTDFVYVRGEVSKASYNSKYKSYTIWLKNGETEEAFELYSVGMAEGLDFSDAVDELIGRTVLCGGYLQKYVDKNGKVILEMPYLAAAKSPTGENFTPKIIEVVLADDGDEIISPIVVVNKVDERYPTAYTEGTVVPVANGYTIGVDGEGKIIYASYGLGGDYGGPGDGFYHDGSYDLKPGQVCGIFNVDAEWAKWPATTSDGRNAWTLYSIVVPEGGFILTGTVDQMAGVIEAITGKNPSGYEGNVLFENEIQDGALNEVIMEYWDVEEDEEEPETPTTPAIVAGTYEVTAASFPESSSSRGAYEGEVSGVKVAVADGLTDAANGHFRVYKNTTLTISCNGKITKVEIDFVPDYGKLGEGFDLPSGATLTEDKLHLTWEGSVSQLVLTAANNQVRITKIAVTVAPAE